MLEIIAGTRSTMPLREPITSSWRRSLKAGVPPVGRILPPRSATAGKSIRCRRALPLMCDVLDGAATEGRQTVLVADEHGRQVDPYGTAQLEALERPDLNR